LALGEPFDLAPTLGGDAACFEVLGEIRLCRVEPGIADHWEGR
jgi:hypothetical protein